jgi:hypothetical protein
VLAKRAEGISQNLHRALQTYNQHANDDLTAALIEHTRSSIVYEKQLLRELEALRPDINNCAIKVTSNIANGVPRPSVVPPLEDFTDPPLTRSETIPSTAPPSTYRPPAVQQPQQPQTHHVQDRGVPVTAIQPSFSRNESSSFGRKDPLLYSIPSSNKHESLSSAPSPAYTQRGLMIPQSPGAGPSTPPNHQITFAVPSDDDAPPLGGRFVEGTKSMFIKRHPSPLSSPALASSSSSQFSPGPLQRAQIASSNRANPLSRASTLPAIDGAPIGINGHGSDKNESLDPLGQGKPNFMSSSLRVPTRSRLDAKEAASKLASMF